MKYIISVMFIASFASSLNGQNWALPSSRWQYICSGMGFTGAYEYSCYDLRVEKDTLVGSQTCKKIVGYSKDFYTYESGDTAYLYLNGAYRPIYYFNPHIGDTVQLYNDTSLYGQSIVTNVYLYGRVDTISTFSFQNLKKIHVSLIDSQSYYVRGFSYGEKIGIISDYAYLFYPTYASVVDAETATLCNYGDSAIPNHWLYSGQPCQVTGINDLNIENTIKCYPNPSIGKFEVDMSNFGADEKNIYLFDQIGRIIYRTASFDNKIILDLRLNPGFYYLKVVGIVSGCVTLLVE
jgi:hypothetical protein